MVLEYDYMEGIIIDLAELTSGSNRDKNIARINGKLLNYCSEVSRKSIASDFAKALISGEPLPARELYGMPFTANKQTPRTSDLIAISFHVIFIFPAFYGMSPFAIS